MAVATTGECDQAVRLVQHAPERRLNGSQQSLPRVGKSSHKVFDQRHFKGYMLSRGCIRQTSPRLPRLSSDELRSQFAAPANDDFKTLVLTTPVTETTGATEL